MTPAEEAATPHSRHRWQADQYGRNARLVADLAADLIDVLDPTPGQRVLDVEYSDGAFSSWIRARGTKVVGIDSAPDMVRGTRSRGTKARVCAAQDFAEEGTFDLAISNAVFH